MKTSDNGEAEHAEEMAPVHEVTFEGDSKKELNKFPIEVIRVVLTALREASMGGRHYKVKVLSGFSGAGVLEIRDQEEGCAYRVFYTTLIKGKICVLHAIKKKSKRGNETPKKEMEIVKKRLKDTRDKYGE